MSNSLITHSPNLICDESKMKTCFYLRERACTLYCFHCWPIRVLRNASACWHWKSFSSGYPCRLSTEADTLPNFFSCTDGKIHGPRKTSPSPPRSVRLPPPRQLHPRSIPSVHHGRSRFSDPSGNARSLFWIGESPRPSGCRTSARCHGLNFPRRFRGIQSLSDLPRREALPDEKSNELINGQRSVRIISEQGNRAPPSGHFWGFSVCARAETEIRFPINFRLSGRWPYEFFLLWNSTYRGWRRRAENRSIRGPSCLGAEIMLPIFTRHPFIKWIRVVVNNKDARLSHAIRLRPR